MSFQEKIQAYAEQPLSKQLLLDILKDYKRPHDKIVELVKKQLLIQLKRGLYLPGPALKITPPEPFLIANHLYGPSYVSLDSALSFWGLIPEKVFQVSSITIRKSKAFASIAGSFDYIQMTIPYYSFGIKQVALTNKQTIILASTEKALCDKIITSSGVILRSVKQTFEYLTEDLRIEKEYLRKLNTSAIDSWLKDAPKSTSLAVLLKTLKSL